MGTLLGVGGGRRAGLGRGRLGAGLRWRIHHGDQGADVIFPMVITLWLVGTSVLLFRRHWH
ncbi:MAG: hypothetical protein ACRDPR_19815 [Nocardioidaceae bacterium]